MSALPPDLPTLCAPRACVLCTHSVPMGGSLACREPSVTQRDQVIPVLQARADTGPCGPEATLLSFLVAH